MKPDCDKDFLKKSLFTKAESLYDSVVIIIRIFM